MMYEILLCFLLRQIFLVYASNNNLHHVRQLQITQTANYRVTYSAGFQYALDDFCTGDKPVLEVSCFGPTMTILNISDPTIICTKRSEATVPNGNTYTCQNTCDGTYCDTIYRYGQFGSIEFMCEGNDLEDVESEYTYLGSNNGRCAASSSDTTLNLHIGRLGVLCPTTDTTTVREYVYDDTYVDCPAYGTNGGTSDWAADFEDYDEFVCGTGSDCHGLVCDVPLANISMVSEVTAFFDTCVDSIVDLTNYPTSSPLANIPGQNVSARFEASWAQLYGTYETEEACQCDTPSLMISCGNSASISYVSEIDSSMNCTKSSKSDMICTPGGGGATLEIDLFHSVFFDCTGSYLSLPKVFYPESNASCINNLSPATIKSAVTLGVFCDIDGEQFYYYRDLAFECGEKGHNFDLVYDKNMIERYVCSESVTFDAGSTTTQTINSVSIYTDWSVFPEGCFMINGESTDTEVVPAPTLIPSTTSPVIAITQTFAPVITNAPVTTIITPTDSTTLPSIAPYAASPTMLLKPTIMPSTSLMDKEKSQSVNMADNASTEKNTSTKKLIGIIIGCFVGGFSMAVLVLLYLNVGKQYGDDIKKDDSIDYVKDDLTNPTIQTNPSASQRYNRYQTAATTTNNNQDGTESNTDADFVVAPFAVEEEEEEEQEEDIYIPTSTSTTEFVYRNHSSNSSNNNDYDENQDHDIVHVIGIIDDDGDDNDEVRYKLEV